MDREHPIPQQISSYQFRLVGDMTIKQFLQVAAGALVAILLYSSSLPPFVKWPLIVFSFLTGIAMAFFPLEDRPIPKWIYLFIKAIYSPTVFIWKTGVKQALFQPEPSQTPQAPTPEEPSKQPEKGAAVKTESTEKLEEKEQEILTKVEKELVQPKQPPTPIAIDLEKRVETPAKPLEKKGPEVKVVSQAPVEVKRSEKVYQAQEHPSESTQTGYQLTPLAGEQIKGIQKAQFSQDAAPPSPPSQANIVVGQVMDGGGKILENAILEIKDSEGRPVRALKTNKLGHFMIVTPLSNGKYEIITEAQGYNFDPIGIRARGKIIPPIAIRSK
jgi:hypothetical protein